MTNKSWTIGWLLWGGMFVALEGAALLNKKKGDTLTDHVRKWGSVTEKSRGWRWRRITLLSFTIWLTVHFNTDDRV